MKNQILFTKKEINNDINKIQKSRINIKYIIILFIFICFILLFSIILFFKLYSNYNNERISKKLNNSYSVATLYANNNYNNPDKLNSSNVDSKPFIIGIIQIDKINLNYSILSICNNELLDISVCKFAGPMPNEIGNLCIAGHNYVDYKFFSRLNELEINDEIKIFDLSGKCILYSIYDIFETSSDDTSCTFQNTNGNKIVTLITCNNVNGKRLIIHAKEIPID